MAKFKSSATDFDEQPLAKATVIDDLPLIYQFCPLKFGYSPYQCPI